MDNTENIIGVSRGNLRHYSIGFGLCILLTIIPFFLVVSTNFSRSFIVFSIILLAIIQAIVHLVFFLHLNFSSAQYWIRLAFIYTLILLIILAGASIWIMYHLNRNMIVS